ncbi:MAG: HEAT repeat domain-containing protein [Clostridia bacterium]|nr:HEAT repeat domain-containing protein [Clostridia bacterium]
MDEEHKLNFTDNCYDDDFCTGEHFTVLRALARDADPYIRMEAAAAAVNFTHPDTKALLLMLTRDEEELVRAEAYDSLSVFPCDEVAQCLTNAMEEEWEPLARSYAILSWADVTVGLCRDLSAAAETVREMQQQPCGEHVRLTLWYALCRFGQEEALTQIAGFLRSRDYHIRCAAVAFLDELCDEVHRPMAEKHIREMLAQETAKSVLSAIETHFPGAM